MNTMRRRADRAEVEAQVADMNLGWDRLGTLLRELERRISNGDHNRPATRIELEHLWTDAEGEADLLGVPLDPDSLDGLVEHEARDSFVPTPKSFRVDAFHLIDGNGPGVVYQLASAEDRERASATLIEEGRNPFTIDMPYAIQLVCVGLNDEGPWDLREAPARWLDERHEQTGERKCVEST